MDILEISRLSGIHHKTLEQFIKQVEKEDPWFDWQQDFDWGAEGPEIRDIGGSQERLDELKRRVHSTLKTEREKAVQIKKAKEEELEYLSGSKEGVKTLLRQIYKDPSLSKKQKEELKEHVIASAPEIATLIALYNGEEREYAQRFLREMVLSPTAELRDLLKGDTLKIRSERGWIKAINDVPLKKPIRSIDFVEKLADFEHMASQPGNGTIAVYKRKKPLLKPVELKPVDPEQLRMGIKVEMEHTDDPQIAEKIARDHLMEIPDYYTRLIKMEEEAIKKPKVELKPVPPKPEEIKPEAVIIKPEAKKPIASAFVAEESKEVTEGNRLPGMEFCYRCGRIVKYDKYQREVKGQTVYYCSEYCYETPIPKAISKYGTGQTVSKETVTEIRRKPVRGY